MPLFSKAQTNSNCLGADPFCTGTTYNFPAGTGTPDAQVGPDYGCLYTTPNPAWYYMQVANNGVISIYMSSTPQHDIDFICWGPFTSPTAPCAAQLTAANTVDCSYSSSWNETCDITNAVSGQYYMLLITNYSNQSCNITFSQTAGAGSTNCGIVAPPIIGDTVCIGQAIHLTVTNPTPNASYSWSGPNGFTSSQMNPSISNATISNAGTYSLVITVGTQVSPAVTTTVQVNPTPVITIGNTSMCQGGAAVLTASGASTYAWNTGINANTIIITPAVTSTYTVTATSAAGCSATSSAVVTVNPNPVIVINQPSVCEGTAATLTASGASTYSWNNGSTTSSISITPLTTTSYTLTGTDTNGCSDTASATVTVNLLPVVTTATTNSYCDLNTGTVTATGGVKYFWSNGDTTSVITELFSGPYTLTVSNGFCDTIVSVIVAEDPKVVASFITNPQEMYLYDGDFTFSNTSENAVSWLWTFGDGGKVESLNASHAYDHVGYFSVLLYVEDMHGCSDTASTIVEVKDSPGLYIPNSFTPNGDGKNDVWQPITYLYDPTEYQLRIFDRWGTQMFESNDLAATWNGTLNNNGSNEDIIADVYVYRILAREQKGKLKEYFGKITIYR